MAVTTLDPKHHATALGAFGTVENVKAYEGLGDVEDDFPEIGFLEDSEMLFETFGTKAVRDGRCFLIYGGE